MTLDVADDRLKVRLTFPQPNTGRLVIEYPYEPEYTDRIKAAVIGLIRPPQSPKKRQTRNVRQASHG